MYNSYAISDGVARIELTHGLFGLVDEADLLRLEPDGVEFDCIGRWRAYRRSERGNYTHYMIADAIRSNGSFANVSAHRLLMGLKRGDRLVIDHIHHDGLDNRRSELRAVTRSVNQHNRRGKMPRRLGETPTSSHPGVYWTKAAAKWRARIGLNGRRIHLGFYDKPDELGAAAAYMRAKAVRDAGGGREEIMATVNLPGRWQCQPRPRRPD